MIKINNMKFLIINHNITISILLTMISLFHHLDIIIMNHINGLILNY